MEAQLRTDMEALHILPLRIFPLKIASLRKARLIKDSQLRGMVELFADQQAGSGLVSPADLGNIFEISDSNRSDVALIEELSELPSFDVYSMRSVLKSMNIEVLDNSLLELSSTKKKQLESYMAEFTDPLSKAIYGENFQGAEDLEHIVKLIDVENLDAAREKLTNLSRALSIPMKGIPGFLQDYAEIYMQIAYYKSSLDKHASAVTDFLNTLSMIPVDSGLKHNISLVENCVHTHNNVKASVSSIRNFMGFISTRTAEMWKDMSPEEFDGINTLIESYQLQLGGALCIITVKMDLWARRFPKSRVSSLNAKADFLMSDMRKGLEKLEPLRQIAA